MKRQLTSPCSCSPVLYATPTRRAGTRISKLRNATLSSTTSAPCGRSRITDSLDGHRAFVPNKAATIIEALCRLAELTGDREYVERYVGPTADSIVGHQVREPGRAVVGAISQATINDRRIDQFFPYYIARCIPGLVAAHRALEDPRYLEAARLAAEFVVRSRDDDGGCPQVVYRDGRFNRYPRWIAAAGDIIKALELLTPLGLDVDVRPTTAWLLAGQLPTGAVRIAEGFAAQGQQHGSTEPPDVRDLLPVVGWNDKAFHARTTLLSPGSSIPGTSATEVEFRQTATWRSFGGHGQSVVYREDAKTVEVLGRDAVWYRWRKGDTWATVRSPTGKPRMDGL